MSNWCALMNYDDIAEDLSFLDSWEDRFAYVIDLGKALPPLDESERNDLTKVEGCASQVWLVPEMDGDTMVFRGQSDAMIVSGLIAVLLAMVNDKTPKEIMAIDVRSEFDKLGLASHLSGQRSNGLSAMAERIRILANQAAS